MHSSIPKTDSPSTWMYPSESQLHAAITRKGFAVPRDDAKYILLMHNVVNEQCWQEICKYERIIRDDDGNKQECSLKRFMGRPNDCSPKAWFKSNILGYVRPFDRHDWYVQRPDGTECRYVIDFYTGPPADSAQVSVHLDVRPALDSFSSAWLRLKYQWRQYFVQ